MKLALFLTFVHLAWMYYWGRTYTRIRRARKYAEGRKLADTNKRYKFIGYLSFATHNSIAIAAFWSNAGWLLKIHDRGAVKLLGVAILLLGTILHAWALRHLGRNYSPCFDSHLPFELVTSGPYRYIRHPDYLAKLVVSFGGFLMTGSLWLFGLYAWLALEVARSISIEERVLTRELKGYAEYRERTGLLLPSVLTPKP